MCVCFLSMLVLLTKIKMFPPPILSFLFIFISFYYNYFAFFLFFFLSPSCYCLIFYNNKKIGIPFTFIFQPYLYILLLYSFLLTEP